jgi:kynurenine formamidase
MMDRHKIIDLTYAVSDSMLVYPNTERPSFSWKGRVNSEGYNLTRMTMIVHTGTHVDSPLHFKAGGAPIDEVSLDRFYGETRVFRLKDGHLGKEFEAGDMEPSIDILENDEIFVIETGIGKFAETEKYNQLYPWPSIALLKMLISKKIRCYMTDATSVDPFGSADSPSHKELFKAGIPIVENLANLEKLPDNSRPVISALPLRLVGREGSPCRAIAIV